MNHWHFKRPGMNPESVESLALLFYAVVFGALEWWRTDRRFSDRTHVFHGSLAFFVLPLFVLASPQYLVSLKEFRAPPGHP
jgi:hypothetical protein